MATERTITAKAADGSMTLAELRAFLDDADAASGHAPDSPLDGYRRLQPTARVRFGGGIKSISITMMKD